MKSIFFIFLFLCINLVNCMTTKQCLQRCTYIVAAKAWNLNFPPNPLPPAPWAYYYNIRACLEETDISANFEERVSSCGGFFAYAWLEDQFCPRTINTEKNMCSSRYRIIHITTPETDTLKEEYLFVQEEYPVFSGYLRVPVSIYVNATKDTVHILRREYFDNGVPSLLPW